MSEAQGPDADARAPVVAVVVNWNAAGLLLACARTLVEAGATEIVVVDNASDDDSVARFEAAGLARVRVVRAGANLGYGAGINRDVKAAGDGHVLVCNPDLLLDQGCIAALAARLAAVCLAHLAGRAPGHKGAAHLARRPP